MRKINNTEFINTSLHVAEIFTLAMEINTLATRAESIYTPRKTDFNNCGVAVIMALIHLCPKALLFVLKEKRKSSGLKGMGVLIFLICRPYLQPPHASTITRHPTSLCLTSDSEGGAAQASGEARLHFHVRLQGLWAQFSLMLLPRSGLLPWDLPQFPPFLPQTQALQGEQGLR